MDHAHPAAIAEAALTALKDRLPREMQPAIIINSGYGIWALWPFLALLPAACHAAYLAIGKRLAALLGGDSIYDLRRIARMPGTLNWRDPTRPVEARLLHCEAGRYFSLDDFDNVLPPLLHEQASEKQARPRPVVAVDPAQEDQILKRARAYVSKMDGAVAGEHGHDRTFEAAQAAVRGFALSEDVAFVVLGDFNERCRPPWSEMDLRRKVREAAEKSRLPEGYLLRDEQANGLASGGTGQAHTAKGAKAPGAVDADAPWGEYEPLDEDVAPPTFPVEVLPEPFRAFVTGVAAASQVDPSLVALPTLACVAIGLSGRAVLVIDDRPEYPCEFFIPLCETGERKGEGFSLATAPLKAWEAKALADSSAENERRRVALDVAERRAKALVDRAAKEDEPQERRDLEDQAIRERLTLTGLPRPFNPELFRTDCTVEYLATALGERGRFAWLAPDGGLVDLLKGRHTTDGASAPLDVILSGWSVEPLREGRITREGARADHPMLTLGVSLQPAKFGELLGVPNVRERGLIGRMQIARVAPQAGERDYSKRPTPRAAIDAYEKAMLTLLGPSSGAKEQTYHLSPEADRLWREFAQGVERSMAPLGDREGCKDWGTRLPSHAARLALELHCMAYPTVEERPKDIGGLTMQGAIMLARFFDAHWRAVMGEAAEPVAVSRARWLAKRIALIGTPTFSRRDLYQRVKQKAGFQKVEALARPLDLLVEQGIIRPAPPPAEPAKSGRPHSPTFQVHPGHFHPHNPQNHSPTPRGGSSEDIEDRFPLEVPRDRVPEEDEGDLDLGPADGGAP